MIRFRPPANNAGDGADDVSLAGDAGVVSVERMPTAEQAGMAGRSAIAVRGDTFSVNAQLRQLTGRSLES